MLAEDWRLLYTHTRYLSVMTKSKQTLFLQAHCGFLLTKSTNKSHQCYHLLLLFNQLVNKFISKGIIASLWFSTKSLSFQLFHNATAMPNHNSCISVNLIQEMVQLGSGEWAVGSGEWGVGSEEWEE